MNKRATNKQYLLGALSPREQAEWENRYLTDDNAFEELANSENDLIDSYTRGRLSPREREQFEKRYCDTPGHLTRLRFAETLRETCMSGGRAAPDNWQPPVWAKMLTFLPAPSLLAWAATVAIAGGVTWFAIQNHRHRELQSARVPQPEFRPSRQGLQPTGAAVPQSAKQRTEGTAVMAKPRRVESAVAALILTPGIVRGAGTSQQTLVIGSGESWVHLQLATEGNYPRHEADLQTVEGRTITHIVGPDVQTRTSDGLVVLRVPAGLLPPGDYVLKLSGQSKDGKSDAFEFYSFRVVR